MYSIKLLDDIQSVASSGIITTGKYHELVESIDKVILNIKSGDDESRMIQGRLRGIASLLAMLLIGEVFGEAYDSLSIRTRIESSLFAVDMDGTLDQYVSNN